MTKQVEVPEAPEGWHWGIGESSTVYYDHWMYTDKKLYPDGEFGWECHLFWDKDGKHHVQFIQLIRWNPNGDHEYDYPSHCKSFETEQEAIEYAISKASELR